MQLEKFAIIGRGRSRVKVSTIGTKQFEAVSEGELGADYHTICVGKESRPVPVGELAAALDLGGGAWILSFWRHGSLTPSVNVVTREFAGAGRQRFVELRHSLCPKPWGDGMRGFKSD